MQLGFPLGEENRAAGGVGPAVMCMRHEEVAVRFFLFLFLQPVKGDEHPTATLVPILV